MLDLSELEALGYRELQKACKEKGISGKGKREELVERLSAHEKASTSGAAAATASTAEAVPATARKADTERSDTLKVSSTLAPRTRRPSLLAEAVASPLPGIKTRAGAKPPLPDIEPASPEPVAAALASPRSSRPAAATTAAKTRSAPRSSSLPWASILSVALLALLLGGGVLWFRSLDEQLVESWRRDAWEKSQYAQQQLGEWADGAASTIRTYPRLAAYYNGAMQYAQLAAQRAQGLYSQLQGKMQAASEGLPCRQQLGGHTFQGIIPAESPWKEKAAAIPFDTAAANEEAGPAQAVGVLLAAPNTAVAHSGAMTLLNKLKGRCGGKCTLHLQGKDLSVADPDARGRLQEALASFLQGCPSGAVLLSGLEQVHAHLLPVLVNALSEQGHFEHEDANVSATQASFWFTAAVPKAIYDKAEQGDEASFAKAVKDRLARRWSVMREDDGAVDREAPATVAALALRRRIEHVLPIQQHV